MLLHSFFIHFFCILLLSALSMSPNISKPGCGDRCGNLDIPYPFGLGDGSNCSIDPWFDIHCDNSTDPPKAYISKIDMEVTEFSEYEVRVKLTDLAFVCYSQIDSNSLPNTSLLNVNLSSTPYTLSSANQLTLLGCDDLATINAQSGNTKYGDACVAYCSDNTDSNSQGSCPGNGCCQTSIPEDTKVINVTFSDQHRGWRDNRLFPCTYLFVGEKPRGNLSKLKYDLSDLNDPFTFDNNNPNVTNASMVLNWRIGSQRCNETHQGTAPYACQMNTNCGDSDSGSGGYNCICMSGYEGNPYLSPGCLDIDECAYPETNSCSQNAICTNKLGGCECSCPRGYIGDGLARGRGCFELPYFQSRMVKAFTGVGSGMGLLLLVLACFWLRRMLRKREKNNRRKTFFKRNGGLLLQQQTSSTEEGTCGETKHFLAKELEKATDHFNESRILGQGGQGTVYKGMLPDGKIVAIKKSKLIDESQLEQFINEVVILSQINHRNVVKLLGCCLETEIPLLIYEFVANGTLSENINNENAEFPISWNMRLKIAADVAGALAYLHSATSIPIFHRDVKSSNILLDEKYVAKVSDFGTSRSIKVDQTHLTTQVKGTFGYLDPEYFRSSQFTDKSDVYSFGVVLVELLTGQRAISSVTTSEERSLATRFLASMEGKCLESILDAQVSDQGTAKEGVTAVARLAQRCLNLNGKKRPTMKYVAMELERIRTSEVPPIDVMVLSKNDYKWSNSVNSIASSSMDDNSPLMSETL